MSSVIEFLERVGQDATLRHASHMDRRQALSEANVSLALQKALLSSDGSEALRKLVGALPNTCCGLYPVEEGPALTVG